MEYDMGLRLREMMALRLDDAVGDMHFRVATDPMAQLVRALCESCLWLLRDWPGQKIDDAAAVRAARLDTLGRLRQLLRARPPKNSEMDSLVLLLSDALLTISEQWPGGATDAPPKAEQQQQLQLQRTPSSNMSTVTSAASSVHIPPVYGAQGTPHCKPPAPKLPRLGAARAWTVDGYEQPSTSNSFPPTQQLAPRGCGAAWSRDRPHASNAGSPSALWTFFAKGVGEGGVLTAKCLLCGRQISRMNHGTSGMKGHLKVHHTAEYATLSMESSAASSGTPDRSPSGPAAAADSHGRGDMDNEEKDSAPVSAIVAALNQSPLPDMNNPPLFDDVKEEPDDMDYDEPITLASRSSSPAEPPGPAHSAAAATAALVEQQEQQLMMMMPPPLHRKGASDIWSYFSKTKNGLETLGVCNLCEWQRKIFNHGTNNMWAHLKKAHPMQYSVLKPYEYNPDIHGPLFHAGLGLPPVPGAAPHEMIARPPPSQQ